MALGGKGLVAEAVPLMWRENGGQGQNWKEGNHQPGSQCGALGELHILAGW